MTTISIQELQRDPLEYLRRVENGESLKIVRDELPIAEILPLLRKAGQLRPIGLCAGQFTVPPDFDQPLPEAVLKEFDGT